MRLRYIFFVAMLLLAGNSLAQNDRTFIRIGNRHFSQRDYAKAETEYRKAIAQNGSNPQAIYNLGCALQAQQKDSAAIKQYEFAGKIETNKIRKSKSYHNIGVICQSRQMYKEAIEAYKESLRNNPSDNETRYNYMLCKRLLKNQKNQNDKQNNKNNQQKNKDNQQKNNKDDQQKNKENKQNDNKQMSKDNAEQLLNAAIQEEKATQQRLKKMMQKPQKRNLDKNW